MCQVSPRPGPSQPRIFWPHCSITSRASAITAASFSALKPVSITELVSPWPINSHLSFAASSMMRG